MIIDTHVHVWEIDPPRYPIGPTAPNWTSLPDEPGTADELLAEMDSHGVDWSVLVQTSWSTWDNGYIADSVARFPNRFVGMGLLDPLAADNAALTRYWVQERGLAGFRFHPMYYPEEKVLLRPENEALWEELAGLDAALQFHLRAAQADQLAAIASRYPHLRLIVDHMGYPEVTGDIFGSMAAFQPILDLAAHDNICFKLSDVKGRSQQPFPFTDVHPFIRALLDAFGTERTIWGTGYPGHHRTRHNWLSLADELRLIQEGLPFLTPAQADRILGDNAAGLFRLKTDDSTAKSLLSH
ncbi:MAG: amidohydrolase family protein [Caldilineaceae bacterium]|nr:amidohydrolase family protein [Caldilineaceae bacterium]